MKDHSLKNALMGDTAVSSMTGVWPVIKSLVNFVKSHTPSSIGIFIQDRRIKLYHKMAWNGDEFMHCDPLVKDK